MEPGSRALRAVVYGVVAMSPTYLVRIVLPSLQNPRALSVVFVLAIEGVQLAI